MRSLPCAGWPVASNRDLLVDDLTHEIPTFDIWQAAYRLHAVVDYWPSDTVFVSVVDPGVGSDRESVVARLANGQLVVTPNNGTLTLLHDGVGVVAVRRIDESKHRLPGSEESHTFHGRDLYAHVGALIAALGLVALAEQDARGYALRSRCDLVCDGRAPLELVRADGVTDTIEMDREQARLSTARRIAKPLRPDSGSSRSR